MGALNYDTHAHLDLYKNKNMKDYINFVEESRCYTIVVTNLPKIYQKYVGEYMGYRYVRFALGLHPQLASQYKSQLPIFCEIVKTSQYIGEVGLDFSRGIEQEQIEIFNKIVECCYQYSGKIISVHSRRATMQVMDIIGKCATNKIILHWFTGTMRELDRAINLGYYFSINTDMINSGKGKKIVECIPTERLLIESDAPFTGMTKQRYDLGFIKNVITKTAEVLNKSEQEIAEIYATNFTGLLQP